MRFKVPKDVDIEDRIAGPLTLKQLGWLGGGVGICIVLWKMVDFQLFVVCAVVVLGLSAGFAFVRPYNQSLIGFCGSVLMFLSKPKQYFWRRIGINFPRQKKSASDKENPDLVPLVRKGLPAAEIEQVAQTLDAGGKIE
jgi:hypothetical protein